MTFPILIPCVGVDDHLSAELAVALTGMGANMGSALEDDRSQEIFFDDTYINDTNLDYINHVITINQFVNRIREYTDDRGGLWGFKFSAGFDLIPLYKYMFPDLSIIIPDMGLVQTQQLLLQKLMNEDHSDSVTYSEAWNHIITRLSEIELVARIGGIPCLAIPHSLFHQQRQRALAKIAEWLGGDSRTKQVANMVDSASRKLLFVYSESEIGLGIS